MPAPGAGRTGSERAARAPWVREVLLALSQLDDLDRRVLRLIYFGELTQAQVAKELAMPIETVREHVARGMIQLAADLIDGDTPSAGGRP
jgi:RNA polymerase sigma factor (sigma-70 family)